MLQRVDLSSFLTCEVKVVNTPPSTAFALAHQLWSVEFIFYFCSKYFKISSESSVLADFSRKRLFDFQLFWQSSCYFPEADFQCNFLGPENMYDSCSFRFVKVGFVAQDVICHGECSLYFWAESVFCCGERECSIDVNRVTCIDRAVQVLIPLLIFCLLDLSITERRLWSHQLKQRICLFFPTLEFCLMDFDLLLVGTYTFKIVMDSCRIM